MEADFSGFATKAGLECSDGRTIMPEAFKHMDGVKVPLVWQHGHGSPENVLGHALLEYRDGDVYAYGYFNQTKQAQVAKALVEHGDINRLSIFANQLREVSKRVFHGMIREVSLVLAGANPGATIDYVAIRHADGLVEDLEDEAIINMGLLLEHASTTAASTSGDGKRTLQDVYDSLTDEQRELVHFMLEQVTSKEPAAHSDTTEGTTTEGTEPAEGADGNTEGTTTAPDEPAEGTTTEGDLTHQEGSTTVTRNVFENQGATATGERHVVTHADMQGIIADAMKPGNTLKSAVEDYAVKHGIDNIDLLFPDPKAITDRPEFDKRRTEWVAGVIGGTRKSPFSRIKSLVADLTQDEARAKGYIKGTLKKEEWFGLTKRTTTPTTVYKKQKLDRDDIVDITDFDVVAWIKAEMRLMLEEELARAVLIGDGRDVDHEDKIKDPQGATDGVGIRSILHDHDLYAGTVYVNIDDSNSSYREVVDEIISSRRLYKGSGNPTFYTTEVHIAKFLTLRDDNGRRYFRTLDELASELRVAAVVPVEPMEDETDLIGIMVNLSDYNIGADRGGEISLFDQFDLDFNQFKYLMETRASGALVKIRSALIYKKVSGSAALVAPVKPTFEDNVITPATTTGVTYKRADTNATVTTGAPITLSAGESLTIYAVPASGSYYLGNNVEDEWTFTFQA